MSLTITSMLDEIARLRRILCREHTEKCTLVRAGAECTCDAEQRALLGLSEVHALRARLIQARIALDTANREVVRLDLQIMDLRSDNELLVEELHTMRPSARGSAPELPVVSRTPSGRLLRIA